MSRGPYHGLALYLAVVLAFTARPPGGRRAVARISIQLDFGIHLGLAVQLGLGFARGGRTYSSAAHVSFNWRILNAARV
jgi:hypothetical protein